MACARVYSGQNVVRLADERQRRALDQAARASHAEQQPVHITLPDGSVLSYDRPVSGDELAHDISLSLAKAAIAIRIDGEMKDLATVIDRDAERRRSSPTRTRTRSN